MPNVFKHISNIGGKDIHIYNLWEKNGLKMPQHLVAMPLKHNPLVCYFEVAFSIQKRPEIKESARSKRGD